MCEGYRFGRNCGVHLVFWREKRRERGERGRERQGDRDRGESERKRGRERSTHLLLTLLQGLTCET